MEPREVLTRPARRPDVVLRYAAHADGVVDLHLPRPDAGPPDLVVLVHGGFWRSEFDRVHTRPMAAALAAAGAVVATPEYRRTGGAGPLAGGWPVTFDDLDEVAGQLPGLLAGLRIGYRRTVVVGHSAGGHLALWLAGRGHPIGRVVALAPVGDLRDAFRRDLDEGAARDLMGGAPDDIDYGPADPATLLQDGAPAELVVLHGTDDAQVPPANNDWAAANPHVELRILPGVDHFALIDPRSPAWPVVRSAVLG